MDNPERQPLVPLELLRPPQLHALDRGAHGACQNVRSFVERGGKPLYVFARVLESADLPAVDFGPRSVLEVEVGG